MSNSEKTQLPSKERANPEMDIGWQRFLADLGTAPSDVEITAARRAFKAAWGMRSAAHETPQQTSSEPDAYLVEETDGWQYLASTKPDAEAVQRRHAGSTIITLYRRPAPDAPQPASKKLLQDLQYYLQNSLGVHPDYDGASRVTLLLGVEEALKRVAHETPVRLTDAECRGVIADLEDRDWRGFTKDDVRMFDELINARRAAQETECAPSALQTERDVYCLVLGTLVRKLDAVHEDPRYKAVWESFMLHGGRYTEPTYTEELERARAVLNHYDEAHAQKAEVPQGKICMHPQCLSPDNCKADDKSGYCDCLAVQSL